MVIVRLIGGLGNQMFQYAAGRSLASKRGVPLQLDRTPFEEYDLHRYGLDALRVQEAFADPEEIARLTGGRRRGASRMLFRAGQKMRSPEKRTVIREEQFAPFNPAVLEAVGDVYLNGYWQSELYFQAIEEIIRAEFQVRTEPDAENAEMAGRIRDCASVSIHIRRGDYVSNEKTNRVHGSLGLDYYRRCVQLLAAEIGDPQFFIFSDDPAWVEENLKLEYPTTYVTHNDAGRNYEDLRLMSTCRHHIIANSSFSWWAAWLNDRPGRRVLAPRRWFRTLDLDTRDLYPRDWTQI